MVLVMPSLILQVPNRVSFNLVRNSSLWPCIPWVHIGLILSLILMTLILLLTLLPTLSLHGMHIVQIMMLNFFIFLQQFPMSMLIVISSSLPSIILGI